MKKLAILLCTLTLIAGNVYAADNTENLPQKKNPPTKEEMIKARQAHEAAFEQKLGLTDEQKTQARELRKQGFEKMKPVMEQIKAKRQEAHAVKQSKISVEAQEEKLIVIDKELQELEKQASAIRKQNMKDFESILTGTQKKTLKNMKKEGREKFERERRLNPHPCPHHPHFEK